jgi:type I restriction-modification system DNA methylase subunit
MKKPRTLHGSGDEGAQYKSFIDTFNSIAHHRHRYEVFKDFVTMAAISLHNAVRKSVQLEEEFLATAKRYTREELGAFSTLLGILVNLLEPVPQDILGELFMALNLGNERTGQFFTPNHISLLMAQINLAAQSNEERGFVKLCEPACGAGGMVLAFARCLIDSGKDPAQAMWARCQDIDRLVALICYTQLSLWNIPAVVIVGDTLANEEREVFYTPAHYLGFWDVRLKRDDSRLRAAELEAKELLADGSDDMQSDGKPAQVQMAWIF